MPEGVPASESKRGDGGTVATMPQKRTRKRPLARFSLAGLTAVAPPETQFRKNAKHRSSTFNGLEASLEASTVNNSKNDNATSQDLNLRSNSNQTLDVRFNLNINRKPSWENLAMAEERDQRKDSEKKSIENNQPLFSSGMPNKENDRNLVMRERKSHNALNATTPTPEDLTLKNAVAQPLHGKTSSNTINSVSTPFDLQPSVRDDDSDMSISISSTQTPPHEKAKSPQFTADKETHKEAICSNPFDRQQVTDTAELSTSIVAEVHEVVDSAQSVVVPVHRIQSQKKALHYDFDGLVAEENTILNDLDCEILAAEEIEVLTSLDEEISAEAAKNKMDLDKSTATNSTIQKHERLIYRIGPNQYYSKDDFQTDFLLPFRKAIRKNDESKASNLIVELTQSQKYASSFDLNVQGDESTVNNFFVEAKAWVQQQKQLTKLSVVLLSSHSVAFDRIGKWDSLGISFLDATSWNLEKKLPKLKGVFPFEIQESGHISNMFGNLAAKQVASIIAIDNYCFDKLSELSQYVKDRCREQAFIKVSFCMARNFLNEKNKNQFRPLNDALASRRSYPKRKQHEAHDATPLAKNPRIELSKRQWITIEQKDAFGNIAFSKEEFQRDFVDIFKRTFDIADFALKEDIKIGNHIQIQVLASEEVALKMEKQCELWSRHRRSVSALKHLVEDRDSMVIDILAPYNDIKMSFDSLAGLPKQYFDAEARGVIVSISNDREGILVKTLGPEIAKMPVALVAIGDEPVRGTNHLKVFIEKSSKTKPTAFTICVYQKLNLSLGIKQPPAIRRVRDCSEDGTMKAMDAGDVLEYADENFVHTSAIPKFHCCEESDIITTAKGILDNEKSIEVELWMPVAGSLGATFFSDDKACAAFLYQLQPNGHLAKTLGRQYGGWGMVPFAVNGVRIRTPSQFSRMKSKFKDRKQYKLLVVLFDGVDLSGIDRSSLSSPPRRRNGEKYPLIIEKKQSEVEDSVDIDNRNKTTGDAIRSVLMDQQSFEIQIKVPTGVPLGATLHESGSCAWLDNFLEHGYLARAFGRRINGAVLLTINGINVKNAKELAVAQKNTTNSKYILKIGCSRHTDITGLHLSIVHAIHRRNGERLHLPEVNHLKQFSINRSSKGELSSQPGKNADIVLEETKEGTPVSESSQSCSEFSKDKSGSEKVLKEKEMNKISKQEMYAVSLPRPTINRQPLFDERAFQHEFIDPFLSSMKKKFPNEIRDLTWELKVLQRARKPYKLVMRGHKDVITEFKSTSTTWKKNLIRKSQHYDFLTDAESMVVDISGASYEDFGVKNAPFTREYIGVFVNIKKKGLIRKALGEDAVKKGLIVLFVNGSLCKSQTDLRRFCRNAENDNSAITLTVCLNKNFQIPKNGHLKKRQLGQSPHFTFIRQMISKFKAVVCKTFLETGTCSFGAGCYFIHENHLQDVTRTEQSIPKQKSIEAGKKHRTVCRYYLKNGGCRWGEGCRYLHETNAKRANERKHIEEQNAILVEDLAGSSEVTSISSNDKTKKKLLSASLKPQLPAIPDHPPQTPEEIERAIHTVCSDMKSVIVELKMKTDTSLGGKLRFSESGKPVAWLHDFKENGQLCSAFGKAFGNFGAFVESVDSNFILTKDDFTKARSTAGENFKLRLWCFDGVDLSDADPRVMLGVPHRRNGEKYLSGRPLGGQQTSTFKEHKPTFNAQIDGEINTEIASNGTHHFISGSLRSPKNHDRFVAKSILNSSDHDVDFTIPKRQKLSPSVPLNTNLETNKGSNMWLNPPEKLAEMRNPLNIGTTNDLSEPDHATEDIQITFSQSEPIGAYFVTGSLNKARKICKVLSLCKGGQAEKSKKVFPGSIVDSVMLGTKRDPIRTSLQLKKRYNSARALGRDLIVNFKSDFNTAGKMPLSGFSGNNDWSADGEWIGEDHQGGWAGGARDRWAGMRLTNLEPSSPRTQPSSNVVTQTNSSEQIIGSEISIRTDLETSGKAQLERKRMVHFGPSTALIIENCLVEDSCKNEGETTMVRTESTSLPEDLPPLVKLRQAVENEKCSDLVAILNNAVLRHETVSSIYETLRSCYNSVKIKIRGLGARLNQFPNSQSLASEQRDFSAKKTVLNIYINSILFLERAENLKDWACFEIAVRNVEFRLSEITKKKLKEAPGAKISATISSSVVEEARLEKLGTLRPQPFFEFIMYADESNPGIRINNNHSLILENRQIHIDFLLEGKFRSQRNDNVLASFTCPVTEMVKHCPVYDKFERIEYQVRDTSELDYGEVVVEAKRIRIDKNYTQAKKLEAEKKLLDHTENIMRFNADHGIDELKLSPNIKIHNGKSILDAAINLVSLPLIQKLRALGIRFICNGEDLANPLRRANDARDRLVKKLQDVKDQNGDPNNIRAKEDLLKTWNAIIGELGQMVQ